MENIHICWNLNYIKSTVPLIFGCVGKLCFLALTIPNAFSPLFIPQHLSYMHLWCTLRFLCCIFTKININSPCAETIGYILIFAKHLS